MSTNPETTPNTPKASETQEVIESTKASTDSLKEEISTTSWTKSELNKWFSEFFKRLKDVWNEFKQLHIGKAIALLFWNTNEETTNEENTNKENNNNENTKQETSSEPTDSTETKTNKDWSTKTEWTSRNIWEEAKEKEPAPTEIVNIKEHMPDIKYDLKYATSDNSFWIKIYPDWESNLKLRYEAIKKLSKAQEILKEQWYQLKIWDAYRPKDAQQKLYDNYKWPASTKGSNVAKPWTSNHWTWKAVDLTLVDSNWNEVEMPTGFDDFSWKATWNEINKLSKDNPKRKNAFILRKAMEQAWFYTIGSEWWHYQTNTWKSTLSHLK